MSLLQKFFLLFLIAGLVISTFADDTSNSSFGFKMKMDLGTEIINVNDNSILYQLLTLNPDFAIGKFGIGLSFMFHFRFHDDNGNFDFRKEEWIPDSNYSLFDVYLPIFRYIRYGHKDDLLYAKIGSIDDATLGNGFIIGNYSNTHLLPEKRMVGLSFSIDGNLLNFPYFGIETFIGNLAKMDVLGARLHINPLTLVDISILNNLEIGMTVVSDREPNALYDFSNVYSPDTVLVYGADYKQPIISSKNLSMAFFGDLAFQSGNSKITKGGMVGIGGQLVNFINYGFNVLFLGDNFIPFYFDSVYDLYRETKYEIYNGDITVDGYDGWLASLGFTFLNDMFLFKTSVDGAFKKDSLKKTTFPHLRSVLIIGEGLLPKVFMDASYDKRYITDWLDFISPENAVIGTNINYKTGAAIITLGYDIRYLPDAQEDETKWETTSKLSTSISF